MIKDRSSPPNFFFAFLITSNSALCTQNMALMMMGKARPLHQALGPTFYPTDSLHGPWGRLLLKVETLFHHSPLTRSNTFLIYSEAETNTTTTMPSTCLPSYDYLFNDDDDDDDNNKGETFIFLSSTDRLLLCHPNFTVKPQAVQYYLKRIRHSSNTCCINPILHKM